MSAYLYVLHDGLQHLLVYLLISIVSYAATRAYQLRKRYLCHITLYFLLLLSS